MSEADAATEQEEAELEGLGVRTLDEIVLPGDEGPDPKAEPAEDSAPERTEITAAPKEEEAAEEEPEEEAPASTLEAVRQKLQVDSGTSEAQPQDAKDLELAQLRQQAILREQEEKKALQERLKGLEDTIAGRSDTPAPKADDGREARVAAAAKFYEERYELEPEQAREMAEATAEHARIEADLKIKEGLAPIEEKWAKAEEYQKQQTEVQQTSIALVEGALSLAKAGGTELELAQDFQKNQFDSFLGKALANLAGNDPQKLTEMLSGPSASTLVEQAGAALARRMEAYAGSEGQEARSAAASNGSTGLGARTSPRTKRANKPTPKANHEEIVAAELEAELGGAEAAFSFLRDDFKWDSP